MDDAKTIVRRAADFFCQHNGLTIVGDWPNWKYRCNGCGVVFATMGDAVRGTRA